MKTLRTLIALPLGLLSMYTLGTAVWNFATALIFQHAGDVVIAFAFLGISVVLIMLASLITPKAPAKMPQIKALTIPADPREPLNRDTIDAGLKALQTAVGGYIEKVGGGDNWTAWADEEGNITGRPFNPRATHAMSFMGGHGLHHPIVGDVVLTGHTPDGEPADLADDVADRAEELCKELSL